MLTKEDICKITGTNIEYLESGDAIIKLTGITDELPEDLHLCTLSLIDSSIKCLPDDLDVQFLEIIRCPNLKTLPDRLYLSSLQIEDSNIDRLPEDFSCSESLSLKNCPLLKKIPDTCIAFSNYLTLYNCPLISVLPKIRVIFGDLNIIGTQIRKLPDHIKIGGSLTVNESSLETIPADIRVGSYIDLRDCKKLQSLPDGLMVNGSLILSGTPIQQLPKALIVEGNLNIMATGIKSLPSDLLVRQQIIGIGLQSQTTNPENEIPEYLSENIWEDSGYFLYDKTLYRVIYQDSFYWRMLDPYTVVSIMLDRNDCYLIDDIYMVTDGDHNYGMSNSLHEAYKDLHDKKIIQQYLTTP